MFSLKLALSSIYRDSVINILSLLSIGIVLFILFSVLTLLINVENVTKALPQKLTIMVFLDSSLHGSDIKQVESTIRNQKIVKSLEFISKEDALLELKNIFKNDEFLLKGFSENPLFDTFNVKVKQEGITVKDIDDFVEKVRSIEGVDNVEAGGEFLNTVYSLKYGLRVLAILTGMVFTFAAVFICYSTVSILFYRYKEEIDIYKLLGATKGFIRVPFFIEGSIIGFLGGLFGTLLLYVLYAYVVKDILKGVPILSLLVVPVEFYYFLPLMGVVVGFIGSAIALGRLKY